jgi:hypothetical protein
MASDPGRKLMLGTIRGARLTSVQFVLDYLILGFDEKGALTTLVWSEIHTASSEVRFGMNDYRNRLCDLINQVVNEATISDDDTISISFENRTFLRVPLQNRKASGERAIFTGPRHQLCVW